jgi:hypothetical protein
MSTYAAIESIVVAVIALVSVFYALKVIVPGPMQAMRFRVADWLGRTANQGSRLSVLVDRLRVDGASQGCATGCDSGGCNGCSVARRVAPQPARDGANRS